MVEPLVNPVISHGRVGDGRLVATRDPHHWPRSGDTVDLDVDRSAIHLLDSATEERFATRRAVIW